MFALFRSTRIDLVTYVTVVLRTLLTNHYLRTPVVHLPTWWAFRLRTVHTIVRTP